MLEYVENVLRKIRLSGIHMENICDCILTYLRLGEGV
jgi:hypothetical protein